MAAVFSVVMELYPRIGSSVDAQLKRKVTSKIDCRELVIFMVLLRRLLPCSFVAGPCR